MSSNGVRASPRVSAAAAAAKPAAGSNKRKRASNGQAGPAAPAQPTAAKTRAAKAAAQAGEQPAEERFTGAALLAERQLELQYWNQFSTPYLYAHLASHKVTQPLVSNWTVNQQRNDRSFMLQLLTTTDGVQRLTAGAEAAELKAEWGKLHDKAVEEAPLVSQAATEAAMAAQAPPKTPAKKKSAAPKKGKQAGAAGSKGQAGAGDGSDQKSDHGQEESKKPSANKKGAARNQSSPASSPSGAAALSEDEEEDEEEDIGGASPAAAASTSGSSSSSEWPQNRCKGCLRYCDRSAKELEFGWFCPNPECGLRGDLSPNGTFNQLRMLERINSINNGGATKGGAKLAASPGSSSSSSSSSSSGQSSTQPAAAAASASDLSLANAISAFAAATAAVTASSKDSRERDPTGGVEAFYTKLARDGPIMTQWKGPTASMPISPMTALQWSRETFEAVTRDRHPSWLAGVVQAGKLDPDSIGWCYPHERGSAQAAMAASSSTTLGQRAPPLASAFEFTIALMCFILPCLASQPAAMFDWMFFGVDVLVMAKRYNSWTIANDYLNRVLTERVTHVTINTDVKTCDNTLRMFSEKAVSEVRLAAQAAMIAGAAGAAGAGAGGQQKRFESQPCFNWNRHNRHCDYGSECKKLHVCHTCFALSGASRKDHSALDSECPQYAHRKLDRAAPHHSGGSNNSQGGNKRDGGGKGGKRHNGGGGGSKGAAASGNSNGGAGGSGNNKEQ